MAGDEELVALDYSRRDDLCVLNRNDLFNQKIRLAVMKVILYAIKRVLVCFHCSLISFGTEGKLVATVFAVGESD